MVSRARDHLLPRREKEKEGDCILLPDIYRSKCKRKGWVSRVRLLFYANSQKIYEIAYKMNGIELMFSKLPNKLDMFNEIILIEIVINFSSLRLII